MSDRGKAAATPEFLEQQRRAEEARRVELERQRIAEEPNPAEVYTAQARFDAEFQGFPATPPFLADPFIPQGSIHTSDIANMFLDEPRDFSSHQDREEVQSGAARIPEPLVRLRRGRTEPSGSGLTVRVRSTYYNLFFYFILFYLFYLF